MIKVIDALESIDVHVPVVVQAVGNDNDRFRDTWEMECHNKDMAIASLKNSILVEGERILELAAIVRPGCRNNKNIIVVQANLPRPDEKD